MLRLLAKHSDNLSGFLQTFLSNEPRPREEVISLGPLWPIPLPYPEVFGRQPAFGASWRKRRLSVQVLVMNWLYLGRPGVCPAVLWLGRKLTPRQWQRIRLLEELSEDANSCFEVDAHLMARSAIKTEAAADQLDALHRALEFCSSTSAAPYGRATSSATFARGKNDGEELSSVQGLFGRFEGDAEVGQLVVAQPIQADRIHFVGSPEFDPLPFFDDATARAYAAPLECSHGVDGVKPPKVSVHAGRIERNKLFQKMADGNRLVPVDPDVVRPGLTSGLFCVPKDLERDRLILDSRPPNIVEPGLSSWTSTMSSATCLSGLELAPDECLIMSGRDIRDFFYQFKVTKQRSQRNVLAGLLAPEDLEFVFRRPFSKPAFVGLNTLAMGDVNSCEYAQGSHLCLIMDCEGAAWHELMMSHRPFPRGLLSVGVVIDDLVCLEKVLKSNMSCSGFAGVSECDRRMSRIMDKYAAVKLPTNDKKAFDNAVQGSFWGVQLDGMKGLVRPNESRLWPLVLVTVRVAALGVATIGLLRSLAGSYISIFTLRRRLLAVMNHIFDAIGASERDSQVVRLSGALRDELFAMLALSTLAVVNLRARTLGTLRATDASDWGMAAVSTELPVPVAKEVHRLSLTKSCWTKLLPPKKAWLRMKSLLAPEEELPGGDVFDVHPFWEQLARCVPYTERWRKKHQKPVHVNIGELRACLLEESRMAVNYVSARVAFALDSQVALGCLVKGRAASKALNMEMMKSIPVVIGSDLYCAYGYWPSKLNRADGPTRDADPDPPDQPLPWWWSAVCKGDFAQFDAWLEEQVDKLASFAQEPLGAAVDLRTGRQVSYDERCKEKQRRFAGCDGFEDASAAVVGGAERLLPGLRDGAGERDCRGLHELPGELHRPPADRALRPDRPCGGGEGECGVLCEEAVAILKTFDARQVLFGDGISEFRHPGALDLYSGRGGVARALSKSRCPWVVTFEITRHPSEDVLSAENRAKILRLISLGAVKAVGSALVCKSFSAAVTPPVRSLQYPRGVPWASAAMKQKIAEGNAMSDFNHEVHQECEGAVPVVFYWTENPDSSFLWRQRKYRKFRDPGGADVCRVDFCRFGTPWRKRTRIVTNVPKLKGLRMLCTCTKPHHVLRGQHPTLKRPWTAVAQPYPRGFAKMVAAAVSDACGWGGPFDIAGCAKCSSLRIGEATNPGPRRPRQERAFSLEQAPVQTWTTINLGERRWALFLEWAAMYLSGDAVGLFLKVPLFLAHALRRYGDLDFMSGGSLLYYRHLILAAQRKVPNLKPFVSICWDLATRWEKVEPVKHRPPVPEIMVEALVALSWQLGWRRWSAVTLLCFHGVARAGEVLKCLRSDLLLPADMMFESDCAFLLLRQSKTMYRQLAKVQHLKISSPVVVRLLALVYRDAVGDERLFHGTPHVYRQRWDFLLKLLLVPPDLRITPGGLRGGGAVSWYRKGGSISELMWLMRLKQIATLEAYLQEVSAISLLTTLPSASRRALRAAASFFRHLDVSLGTDLVSRTKIQFASIPLFDGLRSGSELPSPKRPMEKTGQVANVSHLLREERCNGQARGVLSRPFLQGQSMSICDSGSTMGRSYFPFCCQDEKRPVGRMAGKTRERAKSFRVFSTLQNYVTKLVKMRGEARSLKTRLEETEMKAALNDAANLEMQLALEEELAHHKAAQRMLEHHFVGAQTGYNEMSFLLEATRAEHSEQFRTARNVGLLWSPKGSSSHCSPFERQFEEVFCCSGEGRERSAEPQGPNDKAFKGLQNGHGEDEHFDCKSQRVPGGEQGTEG
eukprot:s4132_g5.t2